MSAFLSLDIPMVKDLDSRFPMPRPKAPLQEDNDFAYYNLEGILDRKLNLLCSCSMSQHNTHGTDNASCFRPV